MPRAWSRRSVLLATGVAGASALTACRVRLEDDAPRIPLLPVRTPMPDERALLAALTESRLLEDAALALGGPRASVPARLAVVHAGQVSVLERVLRDGGAPLPGPEATAPATSRPPSATSAPTSTTSVPGLATATPSGSASATATLGATPARGAAPGVSALVAAEGAALTAPALAGVLDASAPHRPLLAALAAQRGAAVMLLGGTVGWAPTTGPTGAAAVPVLEATRAAAYGFDVVVGQVGAAGLAAATTDLAALRARASVLEDLAGSAAPAPALGYALPFPVSTPAAARALARHLLTSLRTATGAGFAAEGLDAAGLGSLVQWVAQTEVQASRWGAPLASFPGLETP